MQLEGVDTGDFEAVNAAAFLLSTESSKTIFIAVKDDNLPEADETFTFSLKLQVIVQSDFVYKQNTFSPLFNLFLVAHTFFCYLKCFLLEVILINIHILKKKTFNNFNIFIRSILACF